MAITDEQAEKLAAKAESLARAAREQNKNQKDLLLLLDKYRGETEAMVARLVELDRRLQALERGAAHRFIDLLHASVSLQKATGIVLIIAAIVGAVLSAPQVIPLIPMVGGLSNAAK